jgi:hypothetical protein
MALTTVPVVHRVDATVYNGTNGSAIVDWLADAELVSDDGTELVIRTTGWPDPVERRIPAGWHVLRHWGRIYKEALEPSAFEGIWREAPELTATPDSPPAEPEPSA